MPILKSICFKSTKSARQFTVCCYYSRFSKGWHSKTKLLNTYFEWSIYIHYLRVLKEARVSCAQITRSSYLRVERVRGWDCFGEDYLSRLGCTSDTPGQVFKCFARKNFLRGKTLSCILFCWYINAEFIGLGSYNLCGDVVLNLSPIPASVNKAKVKEMCC